MDLRYALRTAKRNRAFALVAILVLALGIAATTSIFSVVNAVLLRPLPHKDPSMLIAISSIYQRNGRSVRFGTVSLNEVEQWRAQSKSLESVGSFVFSAGPLSIGTRSMFLVAIGADPELLDTLGTAPAFGRNLSGRGSKVKEPAVVISHRLWIEAFQGDPQVIGKSVVNDGTPATIVGVLPESFKFPRMDASYFPEAPDLIYPVANISDECGRNSSQWFAIGRLKSGIPIAQAESGLKTITESMTAADPSLRGMSVSLMGAF